MKDEGIYELYRREEEAAEQRRKPQPAQTVWQPGSMEWLAEQEKSRSTAPAPSQAGAAGRANRAHR